MSTVSASGRILDLGPGRFDCLSGELLIEGRRARLRPRTAALLAHLARHADRIVSKDELLQAVWPDAVVTEDSLVQCVKEIRHVFADAGHECIRTVPRLGYAFMSPVRGTAAAMPPPEPAGRPIARTTIAAPNTRAPLLPPSAASSADDPVILDWMLRGWQLFTTYTADGHAQARTVYEAVIRRLPRQVEALVLLGWIHWFDAIEGRSADADASHHRAAELATRALGCGGHKGPPHALMGKVLLWQLRHAEALTHLHRAIELAPDYAYMPFHLADALMWCGQPAASLRHLDRALQLDPDDHGVFLTIRGMAQWMMGSASAARDSLDSALRRNPTYPWARGMLAVLHHEAGDAASARAEALAGHRLNRRFSVGFAERVMPFLLPPHRERVATAWHAAGLPLSEPA